MGASPPRWSRLTTGRVRKDLQETLVIVTRVEDCVAWAVHRKTCPPSGIIQCVQCVQCGRDLTAFHSVETETGILCTYCYGRQRGVSDIGCVARDGTFLLSGEIYRSWLNE